MYALFYQGVGNGSLNQARNSVSCRILPDFSGFTSSFRPVPFGAIFTPKTALIFINNSSEKLGVL
jgi:hypothetical protein